MEIGVFFKTYETGDLRDTYRCMTGQGIYHTQFNLANAGLATLPFSAGQQENRTFLWCHCVPVQRIQKVNGNGMTIT